MEPPEWLGDLDDDCTATWAGFMLRAEQCDEGWWWAVYDDASGARVCAYPYPSGSEARAAAESTVRRLLGLTPQSSR